MRELLPPEIEAIPSLENVVEQARPMLLRFEEQLAAAHNRLKAAGSDQEKSVNQVEYYTLHEQVFRCNQLLRTARHRLSLQAQPKLNPMQGTPAAVKRSSLYERKSKRMLREWMADEDLRDTLSHEDFDPSQLEQRWKSWPNMFNKNSG